MTHDEMIAVIAAHRDGKALQWRHKGNDSGQWRDCGETVAWDFWQVNYRIKPGPREWWFVVDRNGDVDCVSETNEDALRWMNERKGIHTIIHVRDVLP